LIAVDTSAFIRFLRGVIDDFTDRFAEALETDLVYFPPPVLTELLSDPALPDPTREIIVSFPLLPIRTGYWERAGLLRAEVIRAGLKAKLPDVLIAQSCIDHDIPLITYDRDFRHFEAAGLKLI
jgi:predicted nucleic acid-binding protein